MCKQNVTVCFVSQLTKLRTAESFLTRQSVAQKFPAFNGNQSFMAMFVRASLWLLPQATCIQYALSPHTQNYFPVHFNVVFPSISRSSKYFLPYGYNTKS